MFISFSAWGCSKLPGSHRGLISVMCDTLNASAKVARDRTKKALRNSSGREYQWRTGTRMSEKPKSSSTSDKFSIIFCTASLSSWHEKPLICRTCSVYVIYNKSHCLDVSPGSISLSSDLSLHSDPLCGYTLRLSILLILFYFFPETGGFFFQMPLNVLPWECWLLSVYRWIQ